MASDTTKYLVGSAQVFSGVAGSEATTPVSSTSEDGVEVTAETKYKGYGNSESLADEVIRVLESMSAGCKFDGLEFDAANLGFAMAGSTVSGQEVSLDPSTSVLQNISVKIIGKRADGTLCTIRLPYANVTSKLSMKFKKGGMTQLPVEVKAYGSTDKLIKFTVGAGTIIKTLATDILTRDANSGYHQIAGEVAATADTCATISGASLTDNEILRLQIANLNQPITLTHATTGAGHIELDGAVSWQMTKLEDYIDLQYKVTGTKWVELRRYNA